MNKKLYKQFSLDYINIFVTKLKVITLMVGTSRSHREETVFVRHFEMPSRLSCLQTPSPDKGKLLCMRPREESVYCLWKGGGSQKVLVSTRNCK